METDIPKSDEKGQSPTLVTRGIDMERYEQIDPVIEKRTLLKLDTVVMGCFGIMYLLATLDRNNLVSNTFFLLFSQRSGRRGWWANAEGCRETPILWDCLKI